MVLFFCAHAGPYISKFVLPNRLSAICSVFIQQLSNINNVTAQEAFKNLQDKNFDSMQSLRKNLKGGAKHVMARGSDKNAMRIPCYFCGGKRKTP